MEKASHTIVRHKLKHLGELRIDAGLLQGRYPESCSTRRCTGKCCVGGVWTDTGERDMILAHASQVQAQMDEAQEHDPERWFAEERDDADFPSRRAVATAVSNGACVFLNGAGRCVLQAASERSPEPRIDLKPFFCTAFPITIDTGQLEIGEGYDTACCILADHGTQDVFDLCAPELEYMLGQEGARELEEIVRPKAQPTPNGNE